MTIQALIDTLTACKEEYITSKDPYVQKMCRFIESTINGLNMYLNFFTNSKSAIENKQENLTDALETIEKLVPDTDGTSGDDPFLP